MASPFVELFLIRKKYTQKIPISHEKTKKQRKNLNFLRFYLGVGFGVFVMEKRQPRVD